jgi:hypothetical protein
MSGFPLDYIIHYKSQVPFDDITHYMSEFPFDDITHYRSEVPFDEITHYKSEFPLDLDYPTMFPMTKYIYLIYNNYYDYSCSQLRTTHTWHI